MRAICFDAIVLDQFVLTPDVRLLTVFWPDDTHAPHAGQFFTLRAWADDQPPFLSRPISVPGISSCSSPVSSPREPITFPFSLNSRAKVFFSRINRSRIICDF